MLCYLLLSRWHILILIDKLADFHLQISMAPSAAAASSDSIKPRGLMFSQYLCLKIVDCWLSPYLCLIVIILKLLKTEKSVVSLCFMSL
jgi:hypothetical protein